MDDLHDMQEEVKDDFMKNIFAAVGGIWGPFFAGLQKIGKSLLLPISVLPIAAVFLRLGQDDALNNPFLLNIGQTIFDNLPILFAISVAGGVAINSNISTAVAGAMAYFCINAVSNVVHENNTMGVFGGLIAGIIGGHCARKFSNTNLPVFLSFFSKTRFVPIMASVIGVVFGVIFGHLWPYVINFVEGVAKLVVNKGAFGLFIYGVLNRFLIPFGLHSILEKFVYFEFSGVEAFYHPETGNEVFGDLNRFFAGDLNSGMFMSGLYPVMIFGLPAAALVMYFAAAKERRSSVLGLFFSSSLTSMLTGVTEPIEFSFLFAAPVLYLVHSLLTGLSFALSSVLNLKAGFTFSGGLIDMFFSWSYFQNSIYIFVLGTIFFTVYFLLFGFLIYFFKLKTPGCDFSSSVFLSAGAVSSDFIENKENKVEEEVEDKS